MTAPITPPSATAPPPAPCSSLGCQRAAIGSCAYPLWGNKAGQTCGRALCVDHLMSRGGVDYCAGHSVLAAVDAEVRGVEDGAPAGGAA